MEMKDVAERVITNVLENMAFLFPERTVGNETITADKWNAKGFELKFSGANAGSVRMWIEESLAASLAANMLGCDESEINSRKAFDASREILNIITGSLITELYGKKDIIKLHLPCEIDPAEKEMDTCCNEGIWFEVEDKRVLFIVKQG
jgi:chemotaxis protein CheY-P-specific phosphatase CheC